jgi:Holliday junction resolvasome RuvABC endonuclease subunit
VSAVWEDQVRERLARREEKAARPQWEPPPISAFPQGAESICFDPSLSNTGWAWLCVLGDRVRVLAKGTVRSATGKTGYEGTYEKAHCIAKGLASVFANMPVRVDDAPPRIRVSWEAPSVGGGHRTESSLIAGLLVREAALRAYVVMSVVQANRVSSVLAGNPKHDKKEIAAAVARYIPESTERDWNEHIRDAAAVGLTDLLDVSASR